MMTNLLFNQATALGKRLAMVFTMLLIVGIGQAWGADVTWTISGVQTTANNAIVNTALKTSSVTPNTETGVWTAKSTNNSYAGTNSGAQLGASSNREFKGTITLSNTSIPASATITAIKITGKSNGTYTISAKVGENSFGSAITFNSSTNSEKSINGSIVGNSIVLTVSTSTASKYLGISKIVVSYTAATSYTVTYNANGGSGNMTQSTGSSITLKECTFTAPSGKEFDEWNTAANGSGTSYQAGDIVNKSLNLYAIWKELPKYTVTLNAGSGTCAESVTEPNAGDGVTLPTPTLSSACQSEGWSFAGWATASVGTETTTEPTLIAADTYKPASNITLYAVYQRIETTSGGGGGESHSITITPNIFTDKGSNNYGSGAERIGSENAVSFGGHYITGNVKNTPSSGAIAGTYLQCQANNATIYNKTELPGKITKIVVNQYEARAFSLYCGKEQLVASNNTNTGVTPSGTKITDTSSATTMTWNVSGDYTFFAIKKGNNASYVTSIVITYQTDGGQSETTYYHSTPDCGTTEPSYSVTIADNIKNGTVTANPTSATAGTEIALTATPTNGYQFSSWIVTKEGGGTVEVTNNKFTMPASNVTVSAEFTPIIYTITYKNDEYINYTSATPETITIEDKGFELEYSVEDGYELTGVTVTMGGEELVLEEEYLWDKTSMLILPKIDVTGNIVVTFETVATCTQLPTISAATSSDITQTTAMLSCLGISSLGSAGCSITSYGFVWGTTTNPTTSNNKVQVGTTYTTTGTAFSNKLTGLTANTTYYVRPYATNGNGTAYGTEISFKTLDLVKLTTPTNLSVSDISCSNATLAWSAVAGASKYELRLTNISTSNTTTSYPTTNSAYLTLAAGTTYSWTVQAIGDGITYNNSDITEGEDFTSHYTITYNENGGSTVGDDCGTTLPAELPTPTRTHYNFAGWYMDEGFNTPAEAGSVINTNTTLYAKWEEIKFTITWSINGNTTNSQELQEGTTITPPADPEAAIYACEDKVFVGWVGASIDGSTNEEPDFITDFDMVTGDKTYYAVFATPRGDGFTLGQSGDFTIYANVNGTNYYATGEIGATNNGKIVGTTEEGDANVYTFTAISGNNESYTYNIKQGDDYIKFVKMSNGDATTDLATTDTEYTWTISPGAKGSWRVAAEMAGRAIIFRSDSKLFGGYATSNFTQNQSTYYDIEIGGATTYTEYVTSCVTCENVLTISKGNEENGTFTLDKVGEQETCDGLSVLVTPTPAEHYHVASVTASTGETAVNNGDGTYTITYIANSTGESTINVVFEEDTKYTVIWMVNGLPYTIGAPSTTVYADERVATLPTPPEPNAYCGDVFVGWTTENPASGNFNEVPTVYNEQATFPTATGDQTFYAVFADSEGTTPEMPTVIAYWENQALTKDKGVDAKIGTGRMTSNIALSTEYTRTHSNSNISSTYPTLTLSNLNLSSHTNVSLLFWARASQQGEITIKSNLNNDDAIATIKTTTEEKLYVINNIPSSATSITLTYNKNSGSFYFGSVKLYSAATYLFEKLTAENTNGWSGNDWNGYYLITNDQNPLRALDGNGINEDCHFSVADNDGIIEYSIASAFQVEFLADMGYCVKGVGDGLYLGVGDNSVTHSANPIYHESIGYNSLYHSVSSPISILSWNNSGSKFGFYGSIITSAPQMYKIMSELSNYRTLCTYNIEYTNLKGATHSNPETYTAANLPLEFTAPSAREGYTFDGWDPATLSAETRGDQEVEAQWTVNQYTVTWKLNGGQWQGGGTEDRVNNHNYGADVTKPVDPSRTGYTFTGWYPAEIPATMPAENLEFTAQWTPTPYTVTWKLGGVEYATSTVSIENPLSTATAPENPSDGELGCCADKFMGWSSQQSPSAGDVFTKDNIPANVITAKTYYAVFATAAQGVGTSIADFSEMGYENGTAVTDPIFLGDGEGHGDATITLAKAPSSKNDAKYYDDGGAVRVYAGGTITIASTYDGATIKSVTFEFSASDTEGDNTISVTSGDGTYSEGTWTGDATAVTFTIGGSTRHRRIASITVTTGVAGSQYTNYVTSCDKMNDPSLGAVQLTYDSGDAIAVNCGTLSSKSSAASITFSNAVNLTCPITVTAPAGFVLATNRQSDTYTQTVVIKPVKTGENKGKITKKVYVRADAPENSETDYSSNITITGEEITTTTVTVKADVTCKTYTFETLTHIGGEHTSNTYYAGQTIEEAPVEPEKDDCSTKYDFAGWSMTEVAYGSPTFTPVTFPFVMPAEDVTLYPVYICNSDYHRVTSDFGANNWAGDYLIAASETIFANGSHGGTTDVNCIGGSNSVVNPGVDLQGNVVKEFWGNQYKVAFVHVVDGYYVLQTQDGKYNYIGNNASSADLSATESLTTASVNNHPLSIIFDKTNNSVRITNPSNQNGLSLQLMPSNGFRFGKSNGSIYLYKKYLYTSSLICETITAEDAMVTSTAGQTVKVNVTATMSGMTVIRDRTLTVESDNTDFTATITEKVANESYNVAVNYKPSAEDNTDGTETATITIKVNDNPVTTFQVTGRHLPENFVIAAKWGDNWYALPANCVNSGDSKQGILIDVNDINNPTSATAPTTTKYGLRSVKPGRQADFGQSILFTERVSDNQQRALFQNSEETENIWVSAQYENYDGSNPTYYEWIPSTNDLTNYTFTHSASSRKLGVNENGVFGAYTTDVQVRLLTATFYEQVAVQVIKWKANSVIVMYTGAETTATTQVGTNAATDAQTLPDQKITHGIYELTTTQSLTENAGKILTMCFGEAQVKVEIPLIVNGTTTASKNGHDVVILDGGKLTASTTLYSYKNVYVYGGGKLAIPTGTQLGVNNIILRAGGVATNDAGQEATYQYIYPQVDLKGTLTATSQTFLKYEYVTDYDHWYHLVLPFNASFNTITYPQEYYGDNVSATNTGSWQIKRYDGATRATGNYDAWKDIEKDEPKVTQVLAGKGYIYWGAPKKVTIGGDTQRQKWGIQRITMNKQAATATNDENNNKKISDLSSYATVEGNSGKDNDQGWNLIGNPYMVNLTDMATAGLHACKLVEVIDPATGKWNGKWEWNNETDIRYLTIPSDHFDTYTAKTVAQTVPLVPGRAFFVQLEGEANGITFAAANRASLMPALLAENSDKPVDIETGIILSNETLQDEVNFWIKDGKTNDYEYNADYPKTPNNNRFNIYGVHTNGDLSWVAISPELAAESMPIGYQVPAAGTYMLSLSETYYSEDLQALYVTDHAMSPELTVDLMSAPYEFSVNQAETNNERFTVSVILKTQEDDGGGDVGTGVDNAANNNTPCKFIYQDKMYILQNGVIYDAMGKQVQTINK